MRFLQTSFARVMAPLLLAGCAHTSNTPQEKPLQVPVLKLVSAQYNGVMASIPNANGGTVDIRISGIGIFENAATGQRVELDCKALDAHISLLLVARARTETDFSQYMKYSGQLMVAASARNTMGCAPLMSA